MLFHPFAELIGRTWQTKRMEVWMLPGASWGEEVHDRGIDGWTMIVHLKVGGGTFASLVPG